MSTTIQVNENKDPCSRAMKYIIRYFGINIRPGNYYFDKNTKKHIVFLNAIIPNEISPIRKTSKSFVYIFRNIGILIYNEKMNLVEATLSDKIEKKLYYKFWKLHRNVENTIKEYGIKEWGHIGRIRTFLGPLYSIVNRIIDTGELDIKEMKSNDRWKYIIPFINNKLIEIDPYNQNKLICSNLLKQITEDRDQFDAAAYAVGIIVARSTNYLIKELKNYSFVSYIDIPKVYYLDAVEYGELINMPVKDLINKYYILGKRPYSSSSSMNLDLLISEIVNAGLLKKDPDKNTISGVRPLFDRVFEFREEILENISSVSEGFV